MEWKTAKGELLAIFDADSFPIRLFAQAGRFFYRPPWLAAHNALVPHQREYNLLTRLQTIMLDGHFVVEQTTRNRTRWLLLNFNAPPAFGAAMHRDERWLATRYAH